MREESLSKFWSGHGPTGPTGSAGPGLESTCSFDDYYSRTCVHSGTCTGKRFDHIEDPTPSPGRRKLVHVGTCVGPPVREAGPNRKCNASREAASLGYSRVDQKRRKWPENLE